MNLSSRLARALASLYPWSVEPSEELDDSVAFIGAAVDSETVIRAGYGGGVVAAALLMPLFLTPLSRFVVFALVALVSLSVVHGIHSLPQLLAALERTEALGDTPNLIGRAVLRMQIQPSLESAVRFAAETGRGPLAMSLAAHVDRSMGTPRSGLLTFADEWSDEFPALRRSAHLLATAQDAPTVERGRTLDRSLAAILDGTRNRMAEFTSAIRGPSTALFAFGVMLPLALVALVPAVPMAGFSVDIWLFVAVYNLVLPVVLVAASFRLLVRRPVAFPPPTVGRDHPGLPDRLWTRGLWGVGAGIVTYALVATFGLASLAPLAAAGVGLGCGLLAVYRPILEIRHSVRAVETHLTDALYLVGRQVSEGESVESAIELAADRVPGETGAAFTDAAGLQRRLSLSVEQAFLGEYGALSDVPSARARGTAALLAIAANEGRPAGRAIVGMADHIEELEEVEAATKRELASVTDTLDSTAAYFGPLVAGSTVGLAGMMTGDLLAITDTTALPHDELGIVIGIYIVTLCFILTPLSIALRHGLDRALCGYHVGRALLSSMTLYVLTIALVGTIS
ncbi:secretion system protein [Natrarchaeobius halalkaliphilus]|uniref:Secretion system protein n=1 Tax=Natrarchaeobius halalkaliphilus TaxID=1679091 RepID=A0A3N6P509_9EURY|nr:secretion system protein [Natrarchaeobius halalkaliphilus]RQG93119.1 secretion system protein [Natrarchaeobius halalkaliphilus]